ncbi:MAG TPA: 4-hydroxy-tetrahydrodipicolinate synthase [Bacteroidia bacterium]|nr:4-hydroxy-tetrahydrodipicolinate synthase [Bacteroidia bacterium]
MNSKFKGTGVAIVTPFKKDFSVDEPALKKLVNHLIDGKVEYLVILGTTGESVTLSKKEKAQVTACVVKETAGRIPLVLGLGGNHTAELLEQLSSTDFTGIDALLSVSPAYNKPNQEGIYQHFKAIAAASPLPIILYNVPSRTGSNMSAETTLRLAAEFPKFIGIKEASGNLEQCMRIAKSKPKDFLLISGDDNLTIPMISIGAKGVISVIANSFPFETSEAVRHALKDEFDKACGHYFSLMEITDLLFADGSPGGVKAVLKMMDICTDTVRLPLMNVSNSVEEKLKALVDKKRAVIAG